MADVADVESRDVDDPAPAEPVLLRSDAEGVAGLTLNRPEAVQRALARAARRAADASSTGSRTIPRSGSW